MTVKMGIVAWYSAAIIDAPWRIVALFSAAEPGAEGFQLLFEHTFRLSCRDVPTVKPG